MSTCDSKRKIHAAKLANALNAIEAIPISEYANELSQQWVDGLISGEQMKATLLEYHRKLAAQDALHYSAVDKEATKF